MILQRSLGSQKNTRESQEIIWDLKKSSLISKNNHRSRDPELESTIVSSISQKILCPVVDIVDIIGIFEIVDTVIIVDMVDIVSVTRRSRSDVGYSLKDDRLERS